MLRIAIGLGMFFLGLAAGMAATSALDPLRVAPHIYELAFENDRVRVLQRTIRNGETSPLIAQPGRVVIYLNRETSNVIQQCSVIEVELL
jgi:hypothetical protein